MLKMLHHRQNIILYYVLIAWMNEIMYLVTIHILKKFVLGRNLIVSNSLALRDTAIINLLTYHVIVTGKKHRGVVRVRGKKRVLTITYQSSKTWPYRYVWLCQGLPSPLNVVSYSYSASPAVLLINKLPL